MTYTRLAVTPSHPARREAVTAALFAAGAEGLLEDGVDLIVVFDDDAKARAAQSAAREADADGDARLQPFDPGDYTEAWRAGVRAHQVGRVVIAPPWLADEYDARSTIVIDPAMGFGTGEHETTRLSLLLLQDLVRPDDAVADLGCGSGVLAIAAAKLGAGRVAAIDNDPQATTNADENVARNGVRVSVIEGDAFALVRLLAPLRIVVANIIAGVLVELLPHVAASLAPDADVVVGGVLVAERDDFVHRVHAMGWQIVREARDGEWWGAHLRRTA